MNIKKAVELNDLLVTALDNKVFPCAAFAFSKRLEGNYNKEMHYYGYDESRAVTASHFFDLASLTKPLATVPLLLALFERKVLSPGTRLSDIYSNCPVDKGDISIRQLMSHSAGLVAHREYFIALRDVPEKRIKEILLQKIFEEKLFATPGKKYCYSDLGFILLGFIIEKVTGEELDTLTRRIIYSPLKLQKDLLFPSSSGKHTHTYVSTEKCSWSKKRLSGVVHDDNCRAIGGVAGHAGLFGTLQGVISLCEHLLDQWKDRAEHPAYSNTLLQETLKRVGESTWTMGFDMVAQQGSSAGSFFSRKSIGHLGFTGTSFWIDPEKECIVVLLTNRVYYGSENWKIKEFRPIFHDLVMEGD